MIFDKHLQFSDSQALTATAASTNHLNLESDRDIGPGTPLWLVVISRATPGGTSPTLVVSIETDDNSAFSSPSTIHAHGTIAGASFPPGAMVVIPWPWRNQQYNQLRYTLGGTSPTFTVDAFLTSQDPQNWYALPDGNPAP